MPRQRRVEHYIVQPESYNAVIRVLGELPYVKVAGILEDLTVDTQAVFEILPGDKQPPSDQGKIIDTKPEDPRTNLRELEDQPPQPDKIELEDTPDNVVELELPPPANDDTVASQPEESA